MVLRIFFIDIYKLDTKEENSQGHLNYVLLKKRAFNISKPILVDKKIQVKRLQIRYGNKKNVLFIEHLGQLKKYLEYPVQ